MNKIDVVIFGGRDWDNNWITQHRLAQSLSKNNFRVLFIENTGIRSVQIRDLPRIYQRIKNWTKSVRGFRKIDDDLTIFSPLVIPFPYSKISSGINIFLLKRILGKWFEKNKFNNINYITFLATPLINEFIDKSNSFVKIYYCSDNHELASKNKFFGNYERMVVENSDLVMVTAEKLYQKFKYLNKKILKMPAGVELEKFDFKKKYSIPIDLKKVPKPIVGYIGGLNEKFDLELFSNIVKYNKNYSFVLIGAEDGDKFDEEKILNQYKNVFILGKKHHSELPNYISKFDCGIIPYKINKFTDTVYPSKLNELLAMSKPIVSTNFYEISYFNKENSNLIGVAKNLSQFNVLLKKYVKEKKTRVVSIRVKTAQSNSWKNRFIEIKKNIIKLNAAKVIKTKDWEKSFLNEYLKIKRKILKIIFFISASIFLIFVSPLPYYLGEKLVINNEPSNTDLIIGLSGYGNPEYFNSSYQQRALDVLFYYKKGLGKEVLLSGRKQLIEEFELMRAILISLGIPKDKINIINEPFSSTYENLILIDEYMNKNSLHSANIITATYHQKRAKMILDKISKDKKYNLVKITKNDSNRKWFFNFSKTRVIGYEYLSILYNKYKYLN